MNKRLRKIILSSVFMLAMISGFVLKYTNLFVFNTNNEITRIGVKQSNAWYSTYQYRKTLKFDEALITGTTNLTNFPVLLSFTDSSLRTVANGGRVTNNNGYDIVFTDTSNSQLSHEIESYNATTGQIVMWVKIPTLPYNVDTDIYMYYGNGSISTSQENKTSVWNNGYVGVWHLGANLNDSTSNGLNATNPNSATTDVSSVAGNGVTFNGAQRLQIANNSVLHPSAVTVSMWAKRNGAQASYGKPFYNGQISTDPYGVFGFQANNTSDTQFGFQASGNSTGNFAVPYSSASLTDATWYFLAGSYSPSTVSMYVNTTLNTAASSGYAINTSDTTGTAIGGHYASTAQGFVGTIDEVRVANVVRTADWLQAEYATSDPANQGIGAGKFIKSEGSETLAVPIIGSPTNTSIASNSATLGGNITSQEGSAVTAKGICYALTATNSNPQSGGSGVTCTPQGSGGTGVFTQTISGLTQNTGYSYTAYATNTQGTAYTSAATFSTLNVNPTGVDTNSPTGVNSYYVTLSGVANPNSSASTGHFRVYSTNPGNCNSDSLGIRYPQSPGNDVVIGADSSPHTFTYTIPPNANTFLDPNTQYWYCSFAINTNGTTGGSSVASFSTPDGPKTPCDPPSTGNLTIPATAACNLNGNFNGVDTGSGTTNNASLILSTNSSMTIGPSQQVAFGSFQLQKPNSSLTIAKGGSLKKGGVFVHDKDGDGILDDQTQYVGSTASASNEFVRRNLISTSYNYASKIASASPALDCNPNNTYTFQNLAGMVTDADNDGYKTSSSAAPQCVGQQSVINGRTYFKDVGNNYGWLPDGQKLSATADCQDDPNGTPCAPSSVSVNNPSSQTQNNVTFSGTQIGGAVPAGTGFDLKWCTGGSCSPSATLTNVTSVYNHSFTANPSTIYGYAVAAKNAAGTGTYSTPTQYVTTAAACTNTTIYPDTDGDGKGHSGTISQGAVVQKYNNAFSSSLVITKPADIVNGELMIAVIGWGGGSGRTITSVPSGWTQIGSTATNGTATNVAAYYKYASGEGASYTWNFSSSEQQTGFITSYGNAILSPSNPVDLSLPSTGTSTNLTVTGISLNSANEMVVMAVGANPGAASVTFNTAPSGMNEIANIPSSTSDSGGAGDILAGYSEWRSSSGATGDKTAVISASKAYAGIIFALKRPAQVSDVQCLTGGPPGGWVTNSNDCDDTTSSYYQTQVTSRLQDFDADGQGVGSQITVCKGASTRPGTVTNANLDCYDKNANAYVGQASYFSSNRGDGSYDYDCNSADDRNPSISSSTEFYSGSAGCSAYGGCASTSFRDVFNSCNIINADCATPGTQTCSILGTAVSSSTACGASLTAKMYSSTNCTNWGGTTTVNNVATMTCK